MAHLKRDKRGRMLRVYGEDQTRVCPVCNKSFLVPAWRARESGRGKFCSKSCSYIGRELKCTFQAGDKHPAYVDGRSLNKYPTAFKPSLKLKIRERDGYTCQLCGTTEDEHKRKFNRVLVVNHIDFNKDNCSEENLNTLCIGCNTRINWKREYYTNYFKDKVRKHGD